MIDKIHKYFSDNPMDLKEYHLGNIKRKELILKLHTTNHYLQKYFEKYNIPTYFDYLYSHTNHDFFHNIDNEIKAYLLGFYFADGYINKNRMCISVSENDMYILELFQKYISSFSKIHIFKSRHNKKTGYISKPLGFISINSSEICERLKFYGMGSRKTQSSNIISFDFIPDHLFRHFLRGYFDGDGTVYAGKQYINYKNTKILSESFNWSIISYKKDHLILIQSIMKRLYDIDMNILTQKTPNKNQCYLLSVNKKKHFFLLKKILYEDSVFYLRRKKEKYDNIKTEYPISYIIKENALTHKIKKYNSLEEAARHNNVSGTTIKNWIKLNKCIDNHIYYKITEEVN